MYSSVLIKETTLNISETTLDRHIDCGARAMFLTLECQKHCRAPQSMALSSVVSEIFSVEKCRDFEIGVRGNSRSLKVAPFGRSCMVSY